jgi:hypothetical protein
MQKLYLLFIVTFLFVSCHDNESNDGDPGISKKQWIPPVVAKDTSSISAVALSADEMKDDSVFADGSIPTTWANAGVTDVMGLKLFLKQLQLWVMNNDKKRIATAIAYPLRDIKNEQEFVNAYDKFFTKEVKLSFATINFSQLFRNQHGVMTDGGKVWIQQFDSAFKIFAINP